MIWKCVLVMVVMAIVIFVVVSLLYSESYTYHVYVNGNLYHCNECDNTPGKLTLSDCRWYNEPIVILYPANVVFR